MRISPCEHRKGSALDNGSTDSAFDIGDPLEIPNLQWEEDISLFGVKTTFREPSQKRWER